MFEKTKINEKETGVGPILNFGPVASFNLQLFHWVLSRFVCTCLNEKDCPNFLRNFEHQC